MKTKLNLNINIHNMNHCDGLSAKEHTEVKKDEIKLLFDTLTENTTTNIERITGYNINFIHNTLDNYLKQ